jgi:hypothetical protein
MRTNPRRRAPLTRFDVIEIYNDPRSNYLALMFGIEQTLPLFPASLFGARKGALA